MATTRSTSTSTSSGNEHISWFTMLTVPDVVTARMVAHDYAGSGTPDDPYVVLFLQDDPRDPLGFSPWLRWILCLAAAYVTFSVAFISSAFSGSIRDIARDLDVRPEAATLGLSLFLVGFVLGPLVWAPCSGEATYTLPRQTSHRLFPSRAHLAFRYLTQ